MAKKEPVLCVASPLDSDPSAVQKALQLQRPVNVALKPFTAPPSNFHSLLFVFRDYGYIFACGYIAYLLQPFVPNSFAFQLLFWLTYSAIQGNTSPSIQKTQPIKLSITIKLFW